MFLRRILHGKDYLSYMSIDHTAVWKSYLGGQIILCSCRKSYIRGWFRDLGWSETTNNFIKNRNLYVSYNVYLRYSGSYKFASKAYILGMVTYNTRRHEFLVVLRGRIINRY